MGFRGDLWVNLSYKPEVRMQETKNATEHITELEHMRETLWGRLEAAKEAQAKYYNWSHKDISFWVGDLVMLWSTNITFLCILKKLDDQQIGLFCIINTYGKNAYKLHLTLKYRDIHPVFYVLLLEPYYTHVGKPPPLRPIEIKGEQEWYINKILKEYMYQKQKQYYIHWKGFRPEGNTWEPKESIRDTIALDVYEAKQVMKPMRVLKQRKR
jgi:hypothetical protein